MNENLKIIKLTKKLLKEAIDQNKFWNKNQMAPMPKCKALWLLSSPRISDDDYLGVIGIEGDELVSFLFMIPDYMNTNSTKIKKAHWMIDWWVAEKYKETVLGTYIYNEAVKLAKKQILIKGYTENVQAFYDKQPFHVIASRLRYTIFFSLDSSMLLGRFKFLKSFKFLIDSIDSLIGSFIRFINKLKFKKRTQSLKYEYISQLDEETWQSIEPSFKKDLIYKTKEYIDWQISPIQYLQTPIESKKTYPNLQTGISNNIYIHNVKILLENKIIGFMSYIINYNEFNVKYFVVEKDTNYDLCIDALMEHLVKSKRNFVFTDDTKLSNNITTRFKTLFTHQVSKKALTHNETDFDFNEVEMLNRDGHFY